MIWREALEKLEAPYLLLELFCLWVWPESEYWVQMLGLRAKLTYFEMCILKINLLKDQVKAMRQAKVVRVKACTVLYSSSKRFMPFAETIFPTASRLKVNGFKNFTYRSVAALKDFHTIGKYYSYRFSADVTRTSKKSEMCCQLRLCCTMDNVVRWF